MSPFSPAPRDEAALRRELVAAVGGDFEIFREVAGRHLLTGEPVRADLLCFPRQHLRDRGFEPGWFVVETKHLDFARDESRRLYETFWQAISSSLWKVPVLCLCENNLYAMGTAIRLEHAVTDLARRATVGYNVTADSVDGMDVLAVRSATQKALDYVRSGLGPYFLESRT